MVLTCRQFFPFAFLSLAIAICATTARAEFTTIINVPEPGQPTGLGPSSIGSNTQLNLYPGGTLPNGFLAGAADGSSVNFEVNVYGGMVDDWLHVVGDGQANIFAGAVGHRLTVGDGGRVNILGGAVASGMMIESGGVANVFDGKFVRMGTSDGLDTIEIASGGQVNLHEGDLARSSFVAFAGSELHLYVTRLELDGKPIPLIVGQPYVVDVGAEGFFLEAWLARHPDSSFILSGPTGATTAFIGHSSVDYISEALLTVTLVPEPSNISLAVVGVLLGGLFAARRRRAKFV